MKHLFYIFIYLNIYTAFNNKLPAQDLKLTISSEISISATLLDSINFDNTHKNLKSISEEAIKISLKIQQFGFIECKLETIQKINDSVFNAHFFFGNKIEMIKIFYDASLFKKQDIKNISYFNNEKYFIQPISEVEKTLNSLNTNQTKNGNAFARLRLTNFKNKDGEISATLETERGPIRTIDSIAIKGYDKFPKSFLKYYAGVKKGKVFDQKKITEQNNTLSSLGFINTLKTPEALFRKDSTVVYFYLEKRNYNNFDGILGFSTNEETNKLELNGYLNLELNNNLNYGEQLLFNYKADGNDQRNFRIKTTLPYIAKTPLGISLELKIFRRDTTFSNTSQSVNVTYQLKPRTNLTIGYLGKSSSNLLDETLTNIENYKSKFVTLGLNYVKIQKSILFPVKTNILLNLGQGRKTTETNTENQSIIENDISHILPLNDKNSIFIRNNTNVLFSETYLTNELFRFGGIQSIRGFTENSIDATFFSVINTEYRYLLNSSSYIHSIIDLAYFENNVIEQKEKLFSFGLGIGVLTKAGILSLNIANGNIDNQDFKFSNTKIHVSLTSRF
ncbi:membrane protein [Patiriisocius marinistellae]|uniref:Membrane protein n=1 Tax=Patiriisocius marinistellae TaxID=2494560 RepID=A0A5J4FZY9_9FLAO|nr:POTRA domain-containing protein [Patiriisocius marinistellae]GEQ85625.1 membrane protein [Patiriisocius marinistellae]